MTPRMAPWSTLALALLLVAGTGCGGSRGGASSGDIERRGSGTILRFGTSGPLLEAISARMPTMRIVYPPGECPQIFFRGMRTIRSAGRPSVYVDGTLVQGTCILSQLSASEVDRVEVYPGGESVQPGVSANPAGVILVFRLTR